MKRIVLPGSTGQEEAAAGRGGETGALAGLLAWWQHRLGRGDAADPLQSAIGGVDDSGTARTIGLAPATVDFPRPPAVPPGGLSVWVHALGVPDDPAVAGEVYSLVGLGHFYHDAAAGWLSRYATIGRAPAGAASLELRAALTGPPPGDTPVLQIVGVAGQTIDWKVEVYRLERG
jgi:hypothetical protein